MKVIVEVSTPLVTTRDMHTGQIGIGLLTLSKISLLKVTNTNKGDCTCLRFNRKAGTSWTSLTVPIRILTKGSVIEL